jgi:hypothetical protein
VTHKAEPSSTRPGSRPDRLIVGPHRLEIELAKLKAAGKSDGADP